MVVHNKQGLKVITRRNEQRSLLISNQSLETEERKAETRKVRRVLKILKKPPRVKSLDFRNLEVSARQLDPYQLLKCE